MAEPEASRSLDVARWPGGLRFSVESLIVFLLYLGLAKAGLALASIHPNATPVWPPTGLAFGAVLLFGFRVAPAIFAGAFVANITTAGSIVTSLAIASGNTAECLLAGYLISVWSNGAHTFATPVAIAKFALIALCSTPVSASVGVSALSLAGFADWSEFRGIWMTWWLGDLAGALLFTPLVVLWAQALEESKNAEGWMEALAIFIAATLVAIVAFSPLVPDFAYRGALSFLAILPLLWAALRCGPRDTATVAVILSGVAVWGQRADAGPFSLSDPNESFLLLLAFIISVSVPSLALSAATRIRKVTEDELRASESLMREVNARQTLLLAELSHRVNNTLTVVQSIAVRTLSDQLPNDQAKTKLVNRLRALSRAHGLLVNTSWQGARLLDLVEAETEPFATQVEWDGPDVLLTTRSAQSFGLLVHELTTNSCKYGALSTKEGKVQIEWSLRPEPDESCFRFSWSETNGPAVAPPAHHGFGLSLLERAVDLEHGRKPLIAFDPKGFRFEVQVPADRVVVS